MGKYENKKVVWWRTKEFLFFKFDYNAMCDTFLEPINRYNTYFIATTLTNATTHTHVDAARKKNKTTWNIPDRYIYKCVLFSEREMKIAEELFVDILVNWGVMLLYLYLCGAGCMWSCFHFIEEENLHRLSLG